MSTLRLPTSTTEYLKVRVRLDDDEIDPRDEFTPSFALLARGEDPAEDDWEEAEWQVGDGPPYFARHLTHKPVGFYVLWVQVDSDSETVVRESGTVEFY